MRIYNAAMKYTNFLSISIIVGLFGFIASLFLFAHIGSAEEAPSLVSIFKSLLIMIGPFLISVFTSSLIFFHFFKNPLPYKIKLKRSLLYYLFMPVVGCLLLYGLNILFKSEDVSAADTLVQSLKALLNGALGALISGFIFSLIPIAHKEENFENHSNYSDQEDLEFNEPQSLE